MYDGHAKNRASVHTGPNITARVATAMTGMADVYGSTNQGLQTKLKDGEVKDLIKVMTHVKDMETPEEVLILQQDMPSMTLPRLDERVKQELKEIGVDLGQLEDGCLAKDEEIQFMEFSADMEEFQAKMLARFGCILLGATS